jgi:hypothetical protein
MHSWHHRHRLMDVFEMYKRGDDCGVDEVPYVIALNIWDRSCYIERHCTVLHILEMAVNGEVGIPAVF